MPLDSVQERTPDPVVVSLRCDANGRVLYGDPAHDRSRRFTEHLAPGSELLRYVHPAFVESVQMQLREGGSCRMLLLGPDGGAYAATMHTAVTVEGERTVVFDVGELVVDVAQLSPALRLPMYDSMALPEGARVRVVFLLAANTGRLVLQHSPGRILQALSAEVAAAHYAAGPGTTVSTGGLGSVLFTGPFEDSQLASRIRDAVTRRRPRDPHVEFYIGEATGRWPAVVRRAVRAAGYAAEQPERYWFAERHDSDRFYRQYHLRDELRELMGSGALRLDLQPVVDSTDGTIVSAEALLRLEHPEYGAVNPDEILAAVAGASQQVELDRWVITEGARAARQLQEIAPGFRVDVNVTASLLGTSGVVEFIKKHTAGLEAGTFGIEVSEQDSFARLGLVAAKLSALRGLGIGIALDDFGTAASSLACVTLPFDTIKIDRSFVQRVETDAASRGVCIAVAAIAEAVGARVIAEGVETEAHIAYLTELGVHHHQGWWYAKAMRFEEFASRLTRSTAIATR